MLQVKPVAEDNIAANPNPNDNDELKVLQVKPVAEDGTAAPDLRWVNYVPWKYPQSHSEKFKGHIFHSEAQLSSVKRDQNMGKTPDVSMNQSACQRGPSHAAKHKITEDPNRRKHHPRNHQRSPTNKRKKEVKSRKIKVLQHKASSA